MTRNPHDWITSRPAEGYRDECPATELNELFETMLLRPSSGVTTCSRKVRQLHFNPFVVERYVAETDITPELVGFDSWRRTFPRC